MLGLYFMFWARPNHVSHRFLGGLLLMLSIRIGKSVFFYFNGDLAGYFIQFGLSACAFIGPFLLMYLRSVTRYEQNLYRDVGLHFVPMFVFIVVAWLYPFTDPIGVWRSTIISIIYYSWALYIVLSAWVVWPVWEQFWTQKDKLHSVEFWVLGVYIGNVLVWAAYFFCGYTSYLLGAVLFSFMLYLLVVLIAFSKGRRAILFQDIPKYKDNRIADPEAEALLEQLREIMEDEELFRNPNLKLGEVASRLQILPHRLSQLLNDNQGVNFPNFVNTYRITEAKKQLDRGTPYALEALGYEVGFNSKSTFYNAFKKVTGTTPARYKEQLS